MMYCAVYTCFSILFKVTFSDVSNCVRETHNCHEDAVCTNVNGSYYCTCPPGFTGNGTFCKGKYKP